MHIFKNLKTIVEQEMFLCQKQENELSQHCYLDIFSKHLGHYIVLKVN